MESGGRDPSQPPISAEEEALKKNTDCVYFLASPLTCKKGNECEYRHSEGARVNPRDCWYWLNGNCLNPKCLFRHPPLDDFVGGQTSTASGPSPSTEGKKSTKQTVPCYYFQNGCCLKGSRCSFMHGSQPLTFTPKSTPPTAATSSQQSKPEVVNDKGVDFFGPSTKVNGFTVKASKPLSPLTQQPSDFLSHSFDQSNGVNGSQLQPVDQHMEDGREGDDSLRESSPGFDVLVEELEDAGYFQDDEGMGMINGVDFHDDGDFDIDYEFDRYGKSSQYLEERRLDASDLRCKLLMQRKADRPRSAIVAHPHDHVDDHDDAHDHGPRGSQSHHQLPCESASTRRLQGRVKFPGSSYGDNYRSTRSERRRNGRSSSPGRRSGRRKQKPSKRDSRREEEEAGPLSFAGPKSLAELKNRKSPKGDPMRDRPKLMSAVLKRKREEVEEGSGQEERERVSDIQKLENGGHESDDDDDGDDFSRKMRVMLA